MRPRVLKSQTPEFRKFLAAILARRGADGAGIDRAVSKIIADLRKRGDRALIDLTAEFGGVKLTAATIRVTPAQRRSAIQRIGAEDRRALELAARRIADFHRRTMERSFIYRDKSGMRLGQMVQPMRRVGIYVPGGLGAYPSSVLMNAIPAKIVGPGNAFVQAAKRMVYGVADIDKMAGPSEVLVIADDRAHPEWIAADLIAQAEHGSGDETAMLLTTSAGVADRVAEAVEVALKSLPRARQVENALVKRGAMVIVHDLNEAFELANEIAPEHLELDVRNPSRWMPRVKAAGAVLLGPLTPPPLGDYIAGPNHVLPTGGAARFASPLGAYDFLKRTSIIEASRGAIAVLGPVVARLARMEWFEGHARP